MSWELAIVWLMANMCDMDGEPVMSAFPPSQIKSYKPRNVTEL